MTSIRLDTPENTTSIPWMGNDVRLPIRSADTGDRICAQFATLAPGSGNPPHVHTREAECFYVIEGKIKVQFGNGSTELEAGDLAMLPAGLPHQLISDPEKETRLLVLLTRGEIEQAFLAASNASPEQMKICFAEHGVELLDEYDADYRPAGFESVSESDAMVVRAEDGEAFWLAGDTYTIKIAGEAAQDELAIVHFDIPPGGGPVPHVHTRDFEAFVVLDGEVELYADGAVLTGRPGDVAVLPENIPHCFKNRTSKNAEMLAVVAPAGFDRFVHEAGREAIAGQAPPAVDDAEKKRLKEIAPNYGVVLRPDIDF